MKEELIPFQKFAKIGIYPKDLERMPEDLRETILSGKLSPLMRLNVPLGDNQAMQIPMKIQLVYDKDNQLQLLTYQINREIDNRLRLSDRELERVANGDVIQKEFREDGNRRMRYVQLDKETKSLMYRDMATVKFEQKLAEMEKVKDIGLGSSQKEAAALGKPVELNVGDEKVTVGLDLREPQGFKIMKGDMEEWKRQQAIRYDDAHEGFLGYVQTDENRWEYKQVVDRLRYKEEHTVSESQKTERKGGMKM